MQVQATVKYTCTSPRLAQGEEVKNTSLGEDVEGLEFSQIAGGKETRNSRSGKQQGSIVES